MKPHDEDNKHFDDWVRQKMSLIQPEFDEEAWAGMEDRLNAVPASYWINSDSYWKAGVFFALIIIISGLIGLWIILDQDLLLKEAAGSRQEQGLSPTQDSAALSDKTSETKRFHSRKQLDAPQSQKQVLNQEKAKRENLDKEDLTQDNSPRNELEVRGGMPLESNLVPEEKSKLDFRGGGQPVLAKELNKPRSQTSEKKEMDQVLLNSQERSSLPVLVGSTTPLEPNQLLNQDVSPELQTDKKQMFASGLQRISPKGFQSNKPAVPELKANSQPFLSLSKPYVHKKRRLYTGLWFGTEWDQIKGGNSNSSSWLLGLSNELEVNSRWSLNLGAAYTRKSYNVSESADKSLEVDFPVIAATLEIDTNLSTFSQDFFESQLSQVQSDLIEIFVGANYRLSTGLRNRFFIQGGVSSYLFLKQEFIQDYRAVNAQGAATRLLATLNLEENSNQAFWSSSLNLGIGWEHKLTSRTKVQFIPYFKLGLRDIGKENTRLDSYGIRSLILWGW